jgi:hypothetical protein
VRRLSGISFRRLHPQWICQLIKGDEALGYVQKCQLIKMSGGIALSDNFEQFNLTGRDGATRGETTSTNASIDKCAILIIRNCWKT